MIELECCRKTTKYQYTQGGYMILRYRSKILSSVAILTIGFQAQVAAAQDAAADPQNSAEIIVTGTRRVDRTAVQSAVPIDVFTAENLTRQGTSDTNALLQTLVPSFSVPQAAISTGSSFVRPPNLRGLPPDQTLVMVNSKRRHRSALVNIDVSALSLLSQAADLSQIPAIAIDRVEVLRDGASAQYGSDAIAGVINFTLRKGASPMTVQARYGQYYKGDGQEYQLAINKGFALGDNGYINLSGEYVDVGPTSRGTQRPGAFQLSKERPDLTIPNPVQEWGKTKMRAVHLFANGAFDLGDSEVYFFGNYGHGHGDENFNYRQPVSTTNFSRNSLFGVTYYLDTLPNGNRNSAGRTYNLTQLYPNGFTPIFSGTVDDLSAVAGYRGTAGELHYDISASYGQSQLRYNLKNTVNPSFGPASPTSFYLGSLKQGETNFNADFSYPLAVGLASPLNVAWGLEYRREVYEVGLGERASWDAGPFARQVVERPDASTFVVVSSVGSNGSVGFGPNSAGSSSRKSYAGYLDVEADVTSFLTLGGAIRHEHFSSFGDTTNFKGTARIELSSAIALRAAASTGFHAPSPGQTNVNNVNLNFVAGSTTPVQTGTFAVNSPAALYFGAVPVKPERSTNLTGGIVITPGGRTNLTIDYYNISIRDRLGLSKAFAVTAADQIALATLGVANANELNQVQYLTNSFRTRTEGIDLVLTNSLPTDGAGTFDTSLAVNYNHTKVTARNAAIVSNDRVANLENVIPKYRVNFTETWTKGAFSLLARVNYYSSFIVTASSGVGQRFGSKVIADLEAAYKITPNITVAAGAQNLFDTYPDKDLRSIDPNTGLPGNGNQYIDASPFGYNGGQWYVRLTAKF
ncbi:MAG: TonB-dependent receptor [Novosphingobium sp.]